MAIILCLMGPTAAGKTDIAVELTQHLPCDIVSVDSALVYRGLDIGTAKPTADILKIAPHRLIDIRDPADPYSVGQFYVDAQREIQLILKQNRIPLLVGGTMMYFNALQRGISELPSANSEIRAQISSQAEKIGWENLHAELTKIDATAAARIHPNDSQRIQRALEVFYLTGVTLTQLYEKQSFMTIEWPMLNLAVGPSDRNILHQRIEQRFMQLLERGFIEEVEHLRARGDLDLDTPSMRAVGYRQVWEYLDNSLTKQEMIEQGIAATRQLAKRQLTWLRNWQDINWFDTQMSHFMDKILAFVASKVN